MMKCVNGNFKMGDGRFYLVGAVNKYVVRTEKEMTKEEVIDFASKILEEKGIVLRKLINYTVGIEVTELTDDMPVGCEVIIKETGEIGVLKDVTMGMFAEVDMLDGNHSVTYDVEDLVVA